MKESAKVCKKFQFEIVIVLKGFVSLGKISTNTVENTFFYLARFSRQGSPQKLNIRKRFHSSKTERNKNVAFAGS